MPARRPDDPKAAALRAAGALHPRPQSVRDQAFAGEHEFFDARDRVQVKYEMLRRHRVEGRPVAHVAELSVSVDRPSMSPIRPSSRKGFPDCCHVPEGLGAITNAPRRSSISSSVGVLDKMCKGRKPCSRRSAVGLELPFIPVLSIEPWRGAKKNSRPPANRSDRARRRWALSAKPIRGVAPRSVGGGLGRAGSRDGAVFGSRYVGLGWGCPSFGALSLQSTTVCRRRRATLWAHALAFISSGVDDIAGRDGPGVQRR
jgi:hypothetical protein